MSELPERTVEAACAGVWPRHWPRVPNLEAVRGRTRDALRGAMDPALGADRLVVAGPFAQEVIATVSAYLRQRGQDLAAVNAEEAFARAYDLSNPSRRT